MSFAKVVRETRATTSLRWAAEQAGISESYWSDVEHGRRVPTAETAERMRIAVAGDDDQWSLALARERLGPVLFEQVRVAIRRGRRI